MTKALSLVLCLCLVLTTGVTAAGATGSAEAPASLSTDLHTPAGRQEGAEVALARQTDENAPGNPVIGDDRPGDVESEDSTRYLWWGLVGLCLIGAGVLLVRVERWQARHAAKQEKVANSDDTLGR